MRGWITAAVLGLTFALPLRAQDVEGGDVEVEPARGEPGPERLNVDVEDVPLSEVMAVIGRTARVALAVDPDAKEMVTVSLRDIPWREAVEVIARMTRCETSDLPGGGVYVDAQPATVSLSVVDVDVREVLATIARLAGEPVIVLPDVSGVITVELVEAPWREALEMVGQAAGLDVRAWRTLTVVGRAALPDASGSTWAPTGAGPRVDVRADRADLSDLLDEVGRCVGRNVLVDPAVRAVASLDLVEAPWDVVVHVAARQTGCVVEERAGGILVLTRPPRHRLRAAGAPGDVLLQLIGSYAGRNVVAGPGVGGLVFADLTGVSYGEALGLLAAVQGWKLEERGDSLVVTAPPRPEPPLPTTPFEAEVAKLVDDVARLARERRVEELEAAMAALRERVGREAKAAPALADERAAQELEAALEDLFRDIVQLAEARQVEELVTRFTEVRRLLASGGPAADAIVRRLLAKWEQRLADLGEVRLSLLLQLELQAGNDGLQALADAVRRADWDAARAAGDRIDAVLERLRAQEREVFVRNAEALELRAKALRERAAREELLDRRFGALLRVEATLVPDDEAAANAAIVGGAIVREGHTIVDPATGEEVPGLRVIEILETAVRFRFEELELVRELGR